MLPTDFANISKEVSIGDASRILKDMGFDVPNTLRTPNQLDNALKAAPDFSAEQMSEFVNRVDDLYK